MDDRMQQARAFLRDSIRKEIDFSKTDQNRGMPPPPVQRPYPGNARLFDLPKPRDFRKLGKISLFDAIRSRASRREFSSDTLSLAELAFLLWSTQGVRDKMGPAAVLRTVPSAGCRHSFETYLCVTRVDGLKQGVYRYLPLDHKLFREQKAENLHLQLMNACLGQSSVGQAAVTFIWTTVPYRMEWRYSLAAHRVIAIDAGHVCQNLYLACESIDCGTCAVGAYDQEAVDAFLGLDGENEFTMYLAPVGRKI